MTSLTPVYHHLAAVLHERLSVISDRALYAKDPQGHLRQLQAASEKITELQGQLPQPVDPQFAHYLLRCSYDKALAWIEERSTASQVV